MIDRKYQPEAGHPVFFARDGVSFEFVTAIREMLGLKQGQSLWAYAADVQNARESGK